MMAKWGFPDASAEVERLRVENERLRVKLDDARDDCARFRSEASEWRARCVALRAERDDLAARLQSIQQAERTYTAAKLHEAARMRKGEAL